MGGEFGRLATLSSDEPATWSSSPRPPPVKSIRRLGRTRARCPLQTVLGPYYKTVYSSAA